MKPMIDILSELTFRICEKPQPSAEGYQKSALYDRSTKALRTAGATVHLSAALYVQ